MPVTSVTKDPEALTMTVVADFTVDRDRLWQAYTDPRQIEKFWGPPQWPATFLRHDVYPGGRSHYLMRGPDGAVSGGYWQFLSVDPGRGFEVRDGFADAEGKENDQMPSMTMTFTFEDTPQGSRLTTTTRFGSAEQLAQLLEMGMEEGMRAAMGQIDDVIADLSAFAAGRPAEVQILSDTQVRISRHIRGSVEQVWRAHHDAELVQRWMLGPDGWTMPVCEVATRVGARSRYEWEPDDGGEGRFGFTCEVIEFEPPRRVVTTERMIGQEGEGTTNELTLTPVGDHTLLCLVITYPSVELRDMVLGTGMVGGMEMSYARLEREVLG